MSIITKFKAFESLSNGDMDLSKILASDVFQELLSIGVTNATTDRIWNNGNLKLEHPTMKWGGEDSDKNDSITIYSNGPIRGTSNGRPHIIQSAPSEIITSTDGFLKKLEWVLSYFKRKIARDEFGLKQKVDLEPIGKASIDDFFKALFKTDPKKFLDWMDKQEKPVATKALKAIDLSQFIKEDPVKAAMILKKYYNIPEIQEVVKKLDPSLRNEFQQDLNLLGGLNVLGF